jgi:putative glutathione S-transferase
MIEGVYTAEDPGPDTVEAGTFLRAKATIRNWITRDGSSGFPAEAGRYHLYAAWNCPWAHRALAGAGGEGAFGAIGVSYARPRRTPEGWVFDAEGPIRTG